MGKLKIERLIIALVEHGTIEKAAAALGISPVTAWRLMKKPDFQEASRKAHRDQYSRSTARLQYATGTAVNVLYQIMIDKTAPPASRVRAAALILQHAAIAIELEDLAVKVEQLEKKWEERENARIRNVPAAPDETGGEEDET